MQGKVETHEVERSVETTGKIKFNPAQISNPTPAVWKRISTALRYFLVSFITMISATDIFDGGQVKIIGFMCGLVILALGATDLFMGVEPIPQSYSAPKDEQLNNNK